MNGYYNQGMLNQLMRQKDNIDNLISQYSQPPVQNIINTSGIDFEARILGENEEIENVLINKKTMFLDKKNKRLVIKELDGKISEEYEIVIPLDEKDKKILELEDKIKQMEVKFNEYSEFNRSINEQHESNSNANGELEPTTKASSKSVSKQTK